MIILGAGGFAKQLIGSLDFNSSDVVLFDNHNPSDQIDLSKSFSVLTSWTEVSEYFTSKSNKFILGVGSSLQRKALFEKASSVGGIAPKAISARAIVSQLESQIFTGTCIMSNAIVEPYTVVEQGALVNIGSFVAHDCEVGAFSTLGPYSKLLGNVKIGRGCTIGSGAIVLPNLLIGDGAVVGAGAVVTKDVPPNSVVVGNPAKPIKLNQHQ